MDEQKGHCVVGEVGHLFCQCVVGTTTDSGSNFIKAFTVFGHKAAATNVQFEFTTGSHSDVPTANTDRVAEVVNDEDEMKDKANSDIILHETSDILDAKVDAPDQQYHLPRHHRCW